MWLFKSRESDSHGAVNLHYHQKSEKNWDFSIFYNFYSEFFKRLSEPFGFVPHKARKPILFSRFLWTKLIHFWLNQLVISGLMIIATRKMIQGLSTVTKPFSVESQKSIFSCGITVIIADNIEVSGFVGLSMVDPLPLWLFSAFCSVLFALASIQPFKVLDFYQTLSKSSLLYNSVHMKIILNLPVQAILLFWPNFSFLVISGSHILLQLSRVSSAARWLGPEARITLSYVFGQL